jgi:hypothetical protein
MVDLGWRIFWGLVHMVHSYDIDSNSGFQHTLMLLAVVYCAQNFLNDDIVAIKLKPVTNKPSSVEHEHEFLKQLEGGVGILFTLWFGRESTHYALALELLRPSLYNLFLACNHKFSLQTVVNLGDQLVPFINLLFATADTNLFSSCCISSIFTHMTLFIGISNHITS